MIFLRRKEIVLADASLLSRREFLERSAKLAALTQAGYLPNALGNYNMGAFWRRPPSGAVLVQSSTTNCSYSYSLQLPISKPTLAGSLIVVCLGCNSAPPFAITDDKSQSYSLATSTGINGGYNYIYYVPNSVAGVTMITASLDFSVTALVFMEFSAIVGASPLDVAQSNANGYAVYNPNPFTSNTVITSQPKDLLIGTASYWYQALDPTWTIVQNVTTNYNLICGYQNVTSTGAYACTGTGYAGAATYVTASIAAFKCV